MHVAFPLLSVEISSVPLLTLINDILDFSKIEAGKLELEVIDFDLGDLIEGCKKSFSPMAKNKGIQVITELPQNIPLNFRGDAGRLLQILQNLINNAIKFTSTGSVSTKVSILPPASNQQSRKVKKVQLRFDIQDTGIGIPKSSMSRMFQTFSQADSSTTRKFGGTGLGLSICKRLIEMMGGQIGVISKEGQGSTFWFVIELERSSVIHSGTNMKKTGSFVHKNRTARVLVAEDNSANQLVALRALQKMGYRAEAVGNGAEVLAALREIHYDIILMDWHMPEMDGFEATKIIRTNEALGGANIPIIAMTANALESDHKKCLEIGMNDYLSKPVDFELLAQKLEKWLPNPDIKVAK